MNVAMEIKYKNSPMFSIGITTYNRNDMLRQLILSLLDQDFQDYEIIIGNDYQAKKLSLDVLGIYDDRIRIINHEKNLGELQNMNALLKAGRGRYFAWQFDDDLCRKGYLRESYSALNIFNFPLCVLSSYSYIYGTGTVNLKRSSKIDAELFSGSRYLRKFLSGNLRVSILAGFYDIEFLRKLGGVKKLSNGHMALYSEFLLFFQICLLPSVAFINSPLTLIRIHDSSFSSSARELALHKEAGVNLVRESLVVFSQSEVREDFKKNLSSLLKSVICNVIVKSGKRGGVNEKLDISEYILLLKAQIEDLKEFSLYEQALNALEKAEREVLFYKIKSNIKILIPDKYLKFFRFISSLFSPFTNKSF